MNLPGFTAEASLYQTSECYHLTETRNQADEGIHPAFKYTVKDRVRIYVTLISIIGETKQCCSECKRNCYKICPTSECLKYCLPQCTSKCDAYWIGGCP